LAKHAFTDFHNVNRFDAIAGNTSDLIGTFLNFAASSYYTHRAYKVSSFVLRFQFGTSADEADVRPKVVAGRFHYGFHLCDLCHGFFVSHLPFAHGVIQADMVGSL
jgi:hypothetical protein